MAVQNNVKLIISKRHQVICGHGDIDHRYSGYGKVSMGIDSSGEQS